MTDFHVKVESSGIEVWRTTRSVGGSRIRLDRKPARFADKSEMDAALEIFRPGTLVRGRLEVSNDSSG